MIRQALTVVAAVFIGALSAPLAAHHSVSGEFDSARPITFTGKVIKVEWTNPHIYTDIEMQDAAGKLVSFRVEGGSPNALFRQGWRKDMVKPGDTVTVSGIRAKNPASMNVGVATITMSDGRKLFGPQGAAGAAATP